MSDAVQRRRFLIPRESFERWMTQVLLARGFDALEASLSAEFAAIAALYEVETHGARKLLHLLDDEMLRSDSCQPAVEHEVLVRADALEVWDAHRKLGPAVAYLAQQRASELASGRGAGIVWVRNTNHFGWGGAYALHHSRGQDRHNVSREARDVLGDAQQHSGGGGVVAHGQQVLDEDVGVQQHQVRVQLPRHLGTATAQHSLRVSMKCFWMSRLSSN